MNYYERHLGDFAKDTAHLTMIEHGAYNLLLDRYYSTEKGIPADQAYRVGRARTKEEKQAVDTVLSEFFKLEDGVWIKGRVEEEIAKAQTKINAAKENGKKGGRPKTSKSAFDEGKENKPSGFPVGSVSETKTKAHQTPDTNHHSPVKETAAAVSTDSGHGDTDPPSSLSPSAHLATLLRSLEKERGKFCKDTSSNPYIVTWATTGVTEAQVREAHALAVMAREKSGDTNAVNAGFLDVFLSEILNPVQGTSAIGVGQPVKPRKQCCGSGHDGSTCQNQIVGEVSNRPYCHEHRDYAFDNANFRRAAA